MTFDPQDRLELLIEEDDARREQDERALHEPRDDDRLARCPVCQATPNVRCCEFGKDAA